MRAIFVGIVLLYGAVSAAELEVSCGPNDTLLPNPEDCSTFFSCDNGKPILTPCPPSLLFNPDLPGCDYADNVVCSGSTAAPTTTKPTTSGSTTQGPTTSKPTTSAPTTSRPTSTNAPTTATPTTTRPTSTNSPTTASPTSTQLPTSTTPNPSGCPPSGSAILPNPKDCASFLVCINGASQVVNCPKGMEFNQEINSCDLDENVECNLSTEGPTETTTDIPQPTTTEAPGANCPLEGDAVIPNPADCASYIVCIDGNSLIINCPNGLLFNEDIGNCDKTSNCSVATTPQPSSTNGPTTVTSTTSRPTSTNSPTTVTSTTSRPTSTNGPTTVTSTTSRPTSTNSPTTVTSTTSRPTSTNSPSTVTSTTSRPTSTNSPTTVTSTTSQPTSTNGPTTVTSTTSRPTSTNSPTTVTSTTSRPTSTNSPTTVTSTTSRPTSTNSPTTVTSTTSRPTSTNSPTTGTPTTTRPTSTNSPTTGAPTSTTTNPSGCPAEGSLVLPNPEDCASFLVCINGASHVVNCPNGMEFDQETESCDLDENVQCDVSTTTVPDVTTEPPNDGPECPAEGYKIFPNPEDCGSFYVCVNGLSAIINCPEGLDFNVQTNKCDEPEVAQCRPSGSTTPEPESTPDPYNPPCPDEGVVQVPSPTNCSNFYICIDGLSTGLSCPAGFDFNEPKQSCIPTDQSDCKASKPDIEAIRFFEFQCEKDGTFPNPDDCGSYYVCVGNQEIPMSCPAGMHFDATLLSCNTPEAANCAVQTTVAPTSSSSSSTSTATSTSTSAPSPSPTTGSTRAPTLPPSTVSPTPTPTIPPGGEPKCPADGTEFLPNPEDCTSFYVCINGNAGLINCPSGYGYNEETQACDLAENVNCNVEGTDAPPSAVECPETGVTQLPNPESCTSYYFCINGNSAIINCPPGLNYNADTQECDSSTKCTISTNSPPTGTQSTSTSTQGPSSSSTSTSPPDSSSENPPDVDCSVDGILYGNPSDCGSYYMCANGVPVLLPCPPGLEFNSDMLYCDNPATSGCKVSQKKSLLDFLRFWN